MSKLDKTDINEQIAASIKKFSTLARDEASRQRFIIEMPEFIQKKAQLISAHFLLSEGARLADMGCETGEVTYVLASLNPRVEIVGVDKDPEAIEFARKTYRLPNLSFRVADVSVPEFADETFDAIINSNVLHNVYSASGYSTDEVVNVLEMQMRKLKIGGTMLVRDYIMRPTDELVLMEFPNIPSQGSAPETMSEADLLVSFSQNARPMVDGCEGFFIEELMPRREGTRLFRLPHKWAEEFVYRKDFRANWNKELAQEYTFFTGQDYKREFTKIGMRMVFSSPYRNPWIVENFFMGHFQLYNEDYVPLNYPATNYFIIAQRVADKQSLVIEERRPSQKPTGDLQITVVRDKKSGKVHELVKRPGEFCDVVPYRVTPDNRVLIYVRGGYPRPIVNAVSRGSSNLDGKKWSGHLIEPLTLDTSTMGSDVNENRRQIYSFVEKYAELRPKSETAWFVGQTYFPSPDRIEEGIEPVFVEVENPMRSAWYIRNDEDSKFSEVGTIQEIDVTNIILSSQVGLLPDPRLEMHIYALVMKYGVPFPQWIGEKPPPVAYRTAEVKDPEDMLKELEPTEFERETKGPSQLKAVRSVFVEEGKVGRSARGLSSQDVEFIITEDGIENIAVVMPVSHDWDNNLLVAVQPSIMPVPNRLGGDGAMLNAPSFPLPKEVKTVHEAKTYVANIFRVPLEYVSQLGESYFTHTGVTPQRIYPFIVASAAQNNEKLPPLQYAPLKKLWRMTWLFYLTRQGRTNLRFLAWVGMAMGGNHDMTLDKTLGNMKGRAFELSTDKMALGSEGVGYSSLPSRILGQRGDAKPAVDPNASASGVTAIKVIDVASKDPVITTAPMAPAPAAAASRPSISSAYNSSRKISAQSMAAPGVATALNIKGAFRDIRVSQTPTVAALDKKIDAVGDKLKAQRPKAAELKLEPPRPRPTTTKGKQ